MHHPLQTTPERAMNRPNVGVIGLSSMGGGVARSQRACFAVRVCDVRPAVVRSVVRAGAIALAELGAACDGVIVPAVNAEQTEAVLFGDGGAAEAMGKGSVLLMSVTVPPAYAEHPGERLAARGILTIDGPVLGGEAKVVTGEMTVMAAGACEVSRVTTASRSAVNIFVKDLGIVLESGKNIDIASASHRGGAPDVARRGSGGARSRGRCCCNRDFSPNRPAEPWMS
jgi:L-threonate 2-dehydrogenase